MGEITIGANVLLVDQKTLDQMESQHPEQLRASRKRSTPARIPWRNRT